MASIIINIAEKPLIIFEPVSASSLRNMINSENKNLNYVNGTGQQMTFGQILYSEGDPNTDLVFLQIKVLADVTLNGSGSIPIEIYSRPSSTQQNRTIQPIFDSSPMTFNLSYNTIPETKNIDIIIDNRGIRNFSASDFVDKYNVYDGNTISEISIYTPVVGFEYDSAGNNNYVPYVSGTWISINNISKLRWKAKDQDDYYSQQSSWSIKDNMGLTSVIPAYSRFVMIANAFVPSPVQYESYGLGITAQCQSPEEGISIAFNNNNVNGEPFVVGRNYFNSQGYPAQTVRIEGYSDENYFRNLNNGSKIPTSGFVPKRLRNSATNTIITTFPYDIPVANINQITSELGGYKLMCTGNPDPNNYEPMRYRRLTFRVLDSNGNIGPLKESIFTMTETIQ